MQKAVKKFPTFVRVLFSVVLLLSLVFTGCNREKLPSISGTKSVSKSTIKSSSSTAKKSTTKTSSTSKSTSEINPDGDIPAEDNTNVDDDTISEGDVPEYYYDFGGADIVMGTIVGLVTSPQSYPINNDRTASHEYGTDPVLDKIYDFTRLTEQKFNCRIKSVAYANNLFESHTRFAMEVLAGIHTSDIFLTAPLYSMPTFMVQNLIYPISDYLDFDANPYLSDPVNKNSVTYAGKQWGIFHGEPSTNLALVYNLDIRDRDGLEDPMELDMKGQWTWDKCVEILQNATHDFNGDGVIDQWGMALVGPFAANFVVANKGTVVEYRDGKFDFTALDPATIRALTFISDLYNTHKVAKSDWFIYREGKAFMDNISPEYIQTQNARVAAIKNYRHVAYPKGPDNSDGRITTTATGGVAYIPATSKDPEGLAQFMAYFFQTYNNPDLIVDGRDRALNNFNLVYPNDPYAVEYWMKTRYRIDPGKLNWGAWGTPFTSIQDWVQNQVLTNLAKPSLSIRSYIDSVLPVLQGEIDSIAQQ